MQWAGLGGNQGHDVIAWGDTCVTGIRGEQAA